MIAENMLPVLSDIRNRLALFEPPREALLMALVILVGVVSFGLGRLSVEEGSRGGVTIVENRELLEASPSGAIPGGVVASKTGTQYHLPWCAGAQTIREENKVWFKDAAEARQAGYLPAGNCKGIE